jgi:hypothetical protein
MAPAFYAFPVMVAISDVVALITTHSRMDALALIRTMINSDQFSEA